MEFGHLTPVQQRMLDLLRDGRVHTRAEFHACLSDDLASPKAVVVQICGLRRILLAHGLDVVCVALGGRRGNGWRLVRPYANPL